MTHILLKRSSEGGLLIADDQLKLRMGMNSMVSQVGQDCLN